LATLAPANKTNDQLRPANVAKEICPTGQGYAALRHSLYELAL